MFVKALCEELVLLVDGGEIHFVQSNLSLLSAEKDSMDLFGLIANSKRDSRKPISSKKSSKET